MRGFETALAVARVWQGSVSLCIYVYVYVAARFLVVTMRGDCVQIYTACTHGQNHWGVSDSHINDVDAN